VEEWLVFYSSQHRVAGSLWAAAIVLAGWACAPAHPEPGLAAQGLIGQWVYTARSPGGQDSTTGLLTIQHHARGYAGIVQMGGPTADSINVGIDWKGTHVSFAVPLQAPTQQEFVTVSADLQPDHSLVGLWIRDGRSGSWVATPKPSR